MRKILTAVFLIFTSAIASGQAPDDAWNYAQSITEKKLEHTLSIIASEQMQGRETGTEGQRRAAIYISGEFQKTGLKSPAGLQNFQQKYLLYRDSIISQELVIGPEELKPAKDFVLLTGSQLSQSADIDQVIFAGYGIDDEKYSDYTGRDVKGKVVVVFTGEPISKEGYLISGTQIPSAWSFGFTRKISAAAAKGAAGIIITNPRMTSLPRSYTRYAGRNNLFLPGPDAEQKLLAAYVVPSILSHIFTGEQIKQILDFAGKSRPMNHLAIRSGKKIHVAYVKKRFSVYASNIIGFIEGSDLKDQYVVITGHYDHLGVHDGQIYFGADDDGSGTAGVIEIARAFKKAKDEGYGPRRTVVCMLVSGEEKGLWGSEYYSEHPIFPLDKTTVNLNTDMIGRIDPGRKYGDSTNYVYVIGNDKLSSDLDPIIKSVNEKYLNIELDFKFNDPNDPERIYYRSDHYNFARKGVPIIFYFDGIHKDYHKPTDTVEKINFDLMLKRVRYTFLTAWEIANRNQMLSRDIPLPKGAIR